MSRWFGCAGGEASIGFWPRPFAILFQIMSLSRISTRSRLLFHGRASSVMPLKCNDDEEDNNVRSKREWSRLGRATNFSLSCHISDRLSLIHQFRPRKRDHNERHNSMTPTRHNYYHTTTRTEILPLLLAGSVIIGTGIYTYRALEQMDLDAIEYQSKLEEYEAANSYTGGTMAIDVGTTRLKLSHRSKSMNNVVDGSNEINVNDKLPPPIVCVDREGYRSTPSSIWVPPGGVAYSSKSGGDGEMPLYGRMAEARCYDVRQGTIVQPRSILLDRVSNKQQTINDDDAMMFRHAIRVVAKNGLDQVLGERCGGGGGVEEGMKIDNNMLPLFERSATVSGSYDVRPIFTYPPSLITTTNGSVTGSSDDYLEQYRNIVSKLTSPNNIAVFIPEPLAVVVGAEYYGLLPPDPKTGDASSVLVVDVGGITTAVSLVAKEDITYSVTLPFGGNTHIDLLVSLLVDDFFGLGNGGDSSSKNNDDENTDIQFNSKPKLNDPAALQRLHDAAITGIHELSSKTRTDINVPYLSMDATTRQPRHLELDMSRNVVDATVESWIGTKLVPHLQNLSTNYGNDQSVLSSALPPPTDLTSLLSSIIAHTLERTSLNTPFALRAILLVGGGARIPLVRESMTQCVEYLAGDAYTSERLIMPDGEMGDELVVLGATVWGSRCGK